MQRHFHPSTAALKLNDRARSCDTSPTRKRGTQQIPRLRVGLVCLWLLRRAHGHVIYGEVYGEGYDKDYDKVISGSSCGHGWFLGSSSRLGAK